MLSFIPSFGSNSSIWEDDAATSSTISLFLFLAAISAFLIGPNSFKVIAVITINASINML